MMPPAQPALHRCLHCMREFARAEHLIRHERTHTKEKPFQCQLCEQAFSRRDLLRRHEKKAHNQRLAAKERQTSWQTRSRESVEKTNPQRSPVPAGNPPQNSPVSYLLMPATDMTPPDQTGSTTVSISSHDLTNNNMWTSGTIPNWTSADYDINPYIQDCFMPDDLSWPDNLSTSSGQYGINLNDLPDLSQAAFISASNGIADRNLRRTEGGSILSRPCSPPAGRGEDRAANLVSTSIHVRHFSMTEQHWQFMQREISECSPLILPPRNTLSQFIQRYFKSFHRHQPFLHEPTWSPMEAPVPLVLAVCANGALYNLERSTAVNLHRASAAMMKPDDQGLWALQTLMLLVAFAAWSGEHEDLRLALQFQSILTLSLRREWTLVTPKHVFSDQDWKSWRENESLKRVTYCLFTVMNLMTVAYDIPSPVFLEDHFGLPRHEILWCAETEEDWLKLSAVMDIQEWRSAGAVVRRLGDDSLPVPTNVGMFGCHVIVSALLQNIMLFRRSCSGNNYGFLEVRLHYIRALKRWQLMWESEPESSLSPDHPRGPILFNCTAILRAAYIRLVADYSPVRAAFSFSNSLDQIEARISAIGAPRRDPQTTRAVLQACLALRIPVHLGFKVVARTSFWIWSVQHALCYFECALLLSQWLQVAENSNDLSESEKEVLNLVEGVLHASRADESGAGQQSLAVAVLRSWARLLDTEDTTVWQIMPKMAQVLRFRADRLSNTLNAYFQC